MTACTLGASIRFRRGWKPAGYIALAAYRLGWKGAAGVWARLFIVVTVETRPVDAEL